MSLGNHSRFLVLLLAIGFFGGVSNFIFAAETDPELNLEQEVNNSAATSVPTSNEPISSTTQPAGHKNFEPTSRTKNVQSTPANSNAGYIIDERDLSYENEATGPVTVERMEDPNVPYKKRRSHHGFLFSIGMENLEPTEYYSIVDDEAIADTALKTNLSLISAEIGYKYNFQLGSLYATGSFGIGNSKGENATETRELDITKQSLSIGYAADALFDEPWVVPYGQVGVHQFVIDEKVTKAGAESTASMTTSPSLNYRLGLLFQLNWIENKIDPSTHAEGLHSSGLENTFLDAYLTWYEPSSNLYGPSSGSTDGDPDLRSEATFGVALKMEF